MRGVAVSICAFLIFCELLGSPGTGAQAPSTRGASEDGPPLGDGRMGGSGIAGQIMIRPVRPVERLGVPNVRPYQATVRVLDASGQTVTSFQSDANGNFRVALSPGTYVLRPESPGLYPRASEQSIVVSPRTFTEVRIMYDSGIR